MEETSFSSGNAYFKFFVYTLVTGLTAFGIYKGLKYLDGLQDKKLAGNFDPNYKPEFGGNWKLKDCSGREFDNFDLDQFYYVVFFGHTLCPDSTPLNLHKLSKVA